MADRASGLIIKPIGQFVTALSQLYQKPSDDIRGIDVADYGSPLQPVKPVAPAGAEPRGFEWMWGQNLNFTPRSDAEYSAADLKRLAAYPLARICIENVKDQLSKIPIEIRLKELPGEKKKELAERTKADTKLEALQNLFSYPDGEHHWTSWVRPLLDDMLTIDAPAILIRKTFAGEVAQLRVIRGESIVRLIDENGWTPQPPNPAYQQNWWGLPLVNLTTDQLIYRPRNIVPRNTVSSQLYGMSPTEQLAVEIEIGIKRLEFVLAYYTDGSIPGVVHVVPKGTSPDKISEAMMFLNSDLAGNLAARRQWRMIPGFADEGQQDQILPLKEPLLADTFDEMHIRKICFGYGTSPQRLMRMMGTRNAEAQQEASLEEGLLPWLSWLKETVDYIIQRKMGLIGYEATFKAFKETDPVKEAEAAKTLVGGGILTPNEGRGRVGEDPHHEPEADMLGVVGGQFTPITGAGALSTPAPVAAPFGGGGGAFGNEPQGKPGSGKPGTGKPGSGKPGTEENKPGAKPPAAGKETTPPAKGKEKTNGSSFEKAHCTDHPEGYSDSCIFCAQVEIRRLEKQVAPAVAVSRRAVGGGATQLKGGIGFMPQQLVEVNVGQPPVFYPMETELLPYRPLTRFNKKARQRKPLVRAGKLAPSSHDAVSQFHSHIAKTLKIMERHTVAVISARLHLKKAAIGKATSDEESTLREIFRQLGLDWAAVPTAIRPILTQVILTGVTEGLSQIQINDAGMLAEINSLARDWAADRAAELVGMKYDVDGVLVQNPNAQWAISDSTRAQLRVIIRDVFAEKEPTMESLADRIAQAGTFSDERAMMIARTEVIRAEVQGNLSVWQESGLVQTVDWVLSDNHDSDDECDDAADGGPYEIADVPEYPAHPHCECTLQASEITNPDEQQQQDESVPSPDEGEE